MKKKLSNSACTTWTGQTLWRQTLGNWNLSNPKLARERHNCPALGKARSRSWNDPLPHLCPCPPFVKSPPLSSWPLNCPYSFSPDLFQAGVREKGSFAEGPATGLAALLPFLPLAGQAHWAPCASTALGPVDTNPGQPRPLSPGNSCSVSALEGTLRTSVFPEAASGCHQYICSKKGRILPEQGGEQRLQLKLRIVRRARI